MIKYISSWAEQLIICVIIVTILEMILPKGNTKKYIKTIIGIYVLYTIISPVIRLVNGNKFDIDYSKYERYMNVGNISQNVASATVEDTYKVEIEKQIRGDLKDMGYETKKLNFDLSLDDGVISKVYIIVAKIENKEVKENVILVNKIEIGEKVEGSILNDREVKEIKQKINKDYGVDYKEITVNSK